MIAFESVNRSISLRTCWALSPPRFGNFKGYFFFHFSICFSQGWLSSLLTNGIRSSRTSLASPAIETSGSMIFQILPGQHHVDLGRITTEFANLACDSVIPTCTDGHDQITIHDCFIGVGGPMHSQHAHGKGVGFRKCSLTQQGSCDRCLKFFCKSNDLF